MGKLYRKIWKNYKFKPKTILELGCGTGNISYRLKEKGYNIIGSKTFTCTDKEVSYIWENYYDYKKRINEYYMTFFILDEKTKMYRKYEECHYQKSYSIEKIIYLINKSGLKFLKTYNALTFNKENEKVKE